MLLSGGFNNLFNYPNCGFCFTLSLYLTKVIFANMLDASFSMSDEIRGIKIEVHSKAETDRFLVVSLNGTIDTYNGEAVLIRLKELVDHGYNNIMFDCEKLFFLDDMGVGIFFCLRSLIDSDGELKLDKLLGQPEEMLKELGYIEDKSGFPKIMNCPNCSRRVKAYAPGRYRCPFCHRPVVL